MRQQYEKRQERDPAKLATGFGVHAEAGTQLLFSEEDFDKVTHLGIYLTALFFLIQREEQMVVL